MRPTAPRGPTSREAASAPAAASGPDPDLFPPTFLRLLSVAPQALRRLHAGVPDGRRALRGEGGRFLFRGHRAYRPGDDLRRLDWKVAARLGQLVVREFDVERDLLTEVWLDASASLGPWGGRVAAWRAAALAVAAGLADDGRVRLGLVRDGTLSEPLEVVSPGDIGTCLLWLSAQVPQGRAGWVAALPRLRARLPRGARLMLVSDLLSRADPGVLSTFGGRGVRGALLHLRVPEVNAPAPGPPLLCVDAETGEERLVALDAGAAARAAARAQAHADLWARHAAAVGLAYLPFAPGQDEETLLRRLALEAS